MSARLKRNVNKANQVADALHESEERFRMLADNMSQLAWTCDLLGNVTWYNKRWLDYTGLTFEDMKGWGWSKVQHPDHADRVVARVKRSAETGEPWEDTFPLLGRDGNYRWFLSRALPMRDDQGNFIQWFGTNTDVTEQVLAEEQVARQAEELRALNRQLEASDRAKTAFFSNVSHEFRTPLTLILAPVAEVLTDTALSVGSRERLAMAHRNGLRLQKLVNALLDFSRMEAGRAQASYEPTDLAALTRDLASIFRSAMERAGLAFAIDCDDLGELVYVDREMWEKIVLNLLSNAFKYTLQGSVGVRLQREGDQATLEVRDTGVGIPKQEMPRLFERFHRIEGTTGRTQEGSGIGLALVQELVRLHGGTIQAASEPGHGTTLKVWLPLGSAHLPAERIRPARSLPSTAIGAEPFLQEALRWVSGPAEGAVSQSRGLIEDPATAGADQRFAHTLGARIVLADDNADMRAYISRLLGGSYRVKSVADGEQALEVARRERPDLIVADIMMPRLDGLGLLKALRTEDELRDIPIILLSARAGEESRVEGLDAGADDYLVKPFSARELLTRVGARLELARLRRENEARLSSEAAALARLYEASSRLWCTRTLGEGLAEMLAATIELLGADMGNVQILEPERRVLRIVAQSGFEPTFLEFFREVSTEHDSACGRTLRSGQRTIIEDVERDRAYAPLLPVARAAGYRSVQSTPLMSRNGLPLGMISTHWRSVHRPSEQDLHRLDVYARQAADFIEWSHSQAALHESEEKLRLATEAAEVGLWDLNMLAGKLFWPPRVKAMFGISPDVAVSMADFYSGLHPEDRQSTSAAFAAALDPAQRALYDVEYRTVGKEDGLTRWVSAKGRAIFDANGRCVRVIGTAIDITERKRAEEALSEADRRKDEFLAMLAHELRNPLAPIGIAAEILARTLSAESRARSQGAVDIIKRQIAHLTRLVDDLLDVSRITQGRIELKREPVDLARVVTQALETVEPQVHRKHHEVLISTGYEPLWVTGDFERLVQCVSNILSNAIKYTEPGGQIRVRSRSDQTSAVIEITDTGAGIATELLPRIFDLFVQSTHTLDRAQGGLGIGLAVVKRLIDMHAGEVSVRSAGLGQGSTFEIRLPRCARPPDVSVHEMAVQIPPSRVLIVDDNQDAADSLAVLLRLQGHEALAVTRVQAALECLDSFTPDVALLDIGLPEMDGYELAGRIRAQLNRVRLVAITGYGQPEDRQRTQAAGFDDHLVKPIEISALERILVGWR